MKFRNLFVAAALASLAPFLASCEDDSVSPANDGNGVEVTVRDSVVIRDSVLIRDSVVVRDSVVIRDSVRMVDSVHVVDSLNVVDSIHVVDSVQVRDSIRVVDTVQVADTVVVADTAVSIDTLSALEKNNRYVLESSVEGFVPLETVFAGLSEGEKVVAMLRHAERGEDYSSTGPLNDNGVAQALSLGQKLQGDMDIYYAASPSTRTHQTCSNIAKGRGQADTLADTLEFLGGTWFVKDTVVYKKYKDEHSGSWNVTTKWLYENAYADAFYDLAPRSTEYLDDRIIPAFENSGKRYGIFISHDLLIIPLVSYFSSNRIDLKYYSTKKWLNYLAGVAIVLKPDGTRRFYAVKGLDAGTMKKE